MKFLKAFTSPIWNIFAPDMQTSAIIATIRIYSMSACALLPRKSPVWAGFLYACLKKYRVGINGILLMDVEKNEIKPLKKI
jgi:hypothetical protein